MNYPTPLVSIAIPIWNKDLNTVEIFHRCLDSIYRFVNTEETPIELILIDNNSPAHGEFERGRIYQKLTANKDRVPFILIVNDRNQGFGKAINLAAKLARGKYLCQMNSDAELVEDSVSILTRLLETNTVSVAMPEHYEGCKHYNLEKSNELMGKDWRCGFFWIANRIVFLSVGGFDENFDLCYWEDTDLWRRLERAGAQIAGYRGTWVKHVGGASSHPERDALFEKNRRYFESKYLKESL